MILNSVIPMNTEMQIGCPDYPLIVLMLLDVITPHKHVQAWGYVIGTGVHLIICSYVYMYVCDPTKSLNVTLVVNLPFQTLAVDFCRIYRLHLPLRSPETLSSLSKSRISFFNANVPLFVRRMTQLRSQNLIGNIVI